MVLRIDNKTEYLNNYHFQTLCMLYYPGEKFPPDAVSAENEAMFFLEQTEGTSMHAKVRLKAGCKEAVAEAVLDASSFSIPADSSFVAQAVVGVAFLQAGKQLFGFLPPWGYLTGLRPVKRARYYLDRGYNASEVTRLFTEDYRVSDEKAELSVNIADKERQMLGKYSGNDCCLYIAIPFCPTRCEYCSFVSYSNDKLFKTIPDYLDRLDEDLLRTATVIKNVGFTLKSVYIGGGTPSVLDEKRIGRILQRVCDSFDLSKLNEFTFESGRPDTTTSDKLKLVKSYGVDRVSVNPQTTDDAILKRIGRAHTAADFFRAADIATSLGFKSVNGDLIAGLPGDTYSGFRKSLEDLINIGFNNITVHTLSVKNAAPLRFDKNGVYDAIGENARKCVSFARERLKKAELFPYYLYRQKNTVGNAENVGYATSGTECDYNVLMMEETNTVFACGASAITKLVSADAAVIERIAFPKYPFEYLSALHGIGEEKIYSFFNR